MLNIIIFIGLWCMQFIVLCVYNCVVGILQEDLLRVKCLVIVSLWCSLMFIQVLLVGGVLQCLLKVRLIRWLCVVLWFLNCCVWFVQCCVRQLLVVFLVEQKCICDQVFCCFSLLVMVLISGFIGSDFMLRNIGICGGIVCSVWCSVGICSGFWWQGQLLFLVLNIQLVFKCVSLVRFDWLIVLVFWVRIVRLVG